MYRTISEIGAEEEKNRDQYSVLEVVNDEQKRQILNSNKVVLVDIFADWCGPCKQIAPSFSIIARTYARPGLCAVVKERYENLGEQYKAGIRGIPLFLFFRFGEQVDSVVGGDLDLVKQKLESILQSIPAGDLQKDSMAPSNVPPQYKNTIRNRMQPEGMMGQAGPGMGPGMGPRPGPPGNSAQIKYF